MQETSMPQDVHQQRLSPVARAEHTTRQARGLTLRARDIESSFALAQDPMAFFDEEGRMVRANRSFHELLALDSHPEFQTTDPRERAKLFHPRDAHGRPVPATRLPVVRALRGDALIGTVGVDLRARTLDGRELDLHITAMPISLRADRITGCIVVAHDLTETRRATAQLQEAAVRVAALSHEVMVHTQERDAVFEAIADGVLLYDRSGRLLQMNGAARTVLGVAAVGAADADADGTLAQAAERLEDYTQYDVEGKPLPREAWPLARVLRGETMAGRETADAIRRLPDGREQVLTISAVPIYLDEQVTEAMLVLRDVTERRRLEREAAERALEIEGLFEATADGLAFCDAEGRIVRINAAARRLLGYEALHEQEVAPLHAWANSPALSDLGGQALSPDQWPLPRILRGETLSGERAVNVHARRPDGKERVLAVSGAPVYDISRRVIGAIISMRDVTEAWYIDVDRAQMDAFSHDLRSPLTAITMATGLIERRAAAGQPPARDTLEVISDGVAQMTRFVNDLIDALRIEIGHLALKLVPRDLRRLCRNVVREQMHAMQRTIIPLLPKQPVVVNVDPSHISQVLANLLSNALKYSPPDSPVTVRLERNGDMARVEVQDAGPGIPSEAQPYLFKRFYRVPLIEGLHDVGTGLGLYIARALTELHGGQIGVESDVGSGSTFWFTVPLLPHTSG
jgi:signal transduction histidine kinase